MNALSVTEPAAPVLLLPIRPGRRGRPVLNQEGEKWGTFSGRGADLLVECLVRAGLGAALRGARRHRSGLL
ncbi:hypothetical protein [Fodinicola feengrottensis]|uniref:hypothetical protein n=1 Tax=Fodinicola feengrottensis TaxID=435914 RepID=UPI0013D39F4E|nr:hypothetical protein [Fodinicola feengrottensis]